MHKTRGFFPYLFIVFLNAFIDIGHKILIQNTLLVTSNARHYIISSAILNGLILLPYILLFTPSGFISDRYPKSFILKITAASVIPIVCLITVCYYLGYFWLAYILTFILGIQSSLNAPAKYGFIKEIFGDNNITAANAYVQTLVALAILSASFVFSYFFNYFIPTNISNNLLSRSQVLITFAPLGFILITLSLIETTFTFFLPKQVAADPTSQYPAESYLSGKILKQALSLLSESQMIKICVLGLAIYWGINQVIIVGYPAFLKTYLPHVSTFFAQSIPLAMAIIGLLLGSFFAGRISKGFIESGIIPVASLGATFCLFLLPNITNQKIIVFVFILYGIFGGLLIVPLNSLIQFHAPPKKLGRILAANNFIQNIFMLSFLFITSTMTFFGTNSIINLYILAILALVTTFTAIKTLPYSLSRYITSFFITKLYRLNVIGLNNIPPQGGALLLGNHTSFLDWAIIGMSCPRPIRFIIDKSYYNKWYLKGILSYFNVIPIAKGHSKKSIAKAKQALINGDIVVIFPEGRLSRNGHLNKIYPGFTKILEDTPTTVIPFFLHGLWGTPASYAPKAYKRNIQKALRSITLVYGKPILHDCTIPNLKQLITQLSVTAWSQHIQTLSTLSVEWLKRAKKSGHRLALTNAENQSISHHKLIALVSLFRASLKKHLKEQQNIGVLMPPSIPGIVANLSLLCLGKTIININYTLNEEKISLTNQSANIKTIITSKEFIKKLNNRQFNFSSLLAQYQVIYLEDLINNPQNKLFVIFYLLRAQYCPTFLLRCFLIKKTRKTDNAYILFSSGSEGSPKGIKLSHDNILCNIKQMYSVLHHQRNDTFLSCLPLFHAFGLTVTTLLPLLEGIPIACHPDPTDTLTIARLIYKTQATIFCNTASFLRLYIINPRVSSAMIASLRLVISGAEKLNQHIYQEFKQKFGHTIYEGYGCTELSPVTSFNLPNMLDPSDWQMLKHHKFNSVGLPLPGTAYRILNPETDKELPIGESGLISISGPQIMQGYLNNTEATQNILYKHNQLLWYKTGDKGFLDEEGFLTIVDRYSRFAKIAGEMISLSSIEEKILNLLNQEEADIMTLATPCAKKGEKIILLYNIKISTNYIEQLLLSSNIEAYALPADYYHLPELPKLGNGKKDYFTAQQWVITEQTKKSSPEKTEETTN